MNALAGAKLGIIHAAVFTVQVVQPYIDELLPGVAISHLADDTLQQSNLAAPPGCIPLANFATFTSYAQTLERHGMDLIMLACSTFNQAVELAQPMLVTPLLQIDRPMMDRAVALGRRIGLVATLPSTVPSSRRLLARAAGDAGASITVTTVLCQEAFAALRAGDRDRHNLLLMEAIEQLAGTVDCIVLAQVSMAAIEPLLSASRVPVLTSGRTGFTRARELLLGRTARPPAAGTTGS